MSYFYAHFAESPYTKAVKYNFVYLVFSQMTLSILSHGHLKNVPFAEFILNQGSLYFTIQNYPPYMYWGIVLFLGQSLLVWAFLKRPQQNVKKTIGRSFVNLFAQLGLFVLILYPSYLYLNLANMLENLTHELITFKNFKVMSNKKVYQKGLQRIVLIPMVHIADKDFYKNVLKDYHNQDGVVLQEGVKDSQGLIKYDADYKAMAKAIGLTSQKDHFKLPEDSKLRMVTSDMDTSEFSKNTIERLNLIFKLSQEFKENETEAVSDFLKLQLLLSKRAETAKFFHEILHDRNVFLTKKLELMQNEKLVIIPWGALHLPDMENYLIDKGYQLKEIKTSLVTEII
ncbi:MAG: TraB/GumN family protein [Bacteriovoracaceae bacterium]